MEENKKTIVLGGGCFWCTEAAFLIIPGVLEVEPGYSGGQTENPTYEQVCSGKTGHAEVVKIIYDSQKTSLDKILEIFFKVHDPTTLNQQGADKGTQYRSIILWQDEGDEEIIENFIDRNRGEFSDPIVTEVRKLEKFYPAEEYHKRYFEKHPENAYCQAVIRPKLEKIKS